MRKEEKISERFSRLLEESGKGQRELAELLGVTERTIRNYKTGKTVKIPSDFIDKVAKLFNVSPSWLYGGEEETPIKKDDTRAYGVENVDTDLVPDEESLVDILNKQIHTLQSVTETMREVIVAQNEQIKDLQQIIYNLTNDNKKEVER